MNTARQADNIIKTITILFVFSFTAFFFPAPCRSAPQAGRPAEKNELIDRVVQNWLQISTEQYENGQYELAQESLNRARGYYEYLDDRQKQQINHLAQRIRDAGNQKQQLLEKLDVAAELISQGEFLKARAYLVEAQRSGLLDENQQQRVKLSLERVDAKIEEQKRLMKDLYKRSRKHYEQGNFEKARQGFAVVASSGLYVPAFGKTAQQYLAEISRQPTMKKDSQVSPERKKSEKDRGFLPWFSADDKNKLTDLQSPQPEGMQAEKTLKTKPENKALIQALQPEEAGNKKQETNAHKTSLKQDYIRAVVRNAQKNVDRFLGQAEFSNAEAVVGNAQKILNKYRVQLPEPFYINQQQKLEKLSYEIIEQKRQWQLRWDTKD